MRRFPSRTPYGYGGTIEASIRERNNRSCIGELVGAINGQGPERARNGFLRVCGGARHAKYRICEWAASSGQHELLGSAFHWNLIGIQVPRREGCLDSHLLPSPWGGSFSSCQPVHFYTRDVESRNSEEEGTFWTGETRWGGEKGFGSVCCQRATGETRSLDESYELFYVFLYRYSFQFTERRSRGLINQDKKERKKRFEELV